MSPSFIFPLQELLVSKLLRTATLAGVGTEAVIADFLASHTTLPQQQMAAAAAAVVADAASSGRPSDQQMRRDGGGGGAVVVERLI